MNLHWLTLDRAREVVFGLTFWQVFKASNEKSRIFAVDHRDWTRLSLVPILPGNDRSVASLVIELDCDSVP